VASHRAGRGGHHRSRHLRHHRHRDRRRRPAPRRRPAIILSFLLTALTCGFAALCYAEFAAMVPISGSAYTYAYASLGELVAWIIGWDLIIEYAVGNIGVAIGWSGYFRELLTHFGLSLPAWLATDYRSAHLAAEAIASGATDPSSQYLASALTTAPDVFGFPSSPTFPPSHRGRSPWCLIGIRGRPTRTTRWCCSRSASSCSSAPWGAR
jgi:amino acid transporter